MARGGWRGPLWKFEFTPGTVGALGLLGMALLLASAWAFGAIIGSHLLHSAPA